MAKRKSPAKPTPKSVSQAGAQGQTDNQNDSQNADDTTKKSIDADRKDNEGHVIQAADGDGATKDGAALVARARSGETKSACWERLRKEARLAGLPRGQGAGTAYEWATIEADRLFPPVSEPEPVAEIPEPPADPLEPEPPATDGLAGLSEIPGDWPDLPDNAALPTEVQWVQANRVRVRDGNRVDLSRARTPAPSYATLSWLETAILFPAKWADIVAKATSQQQDEREHTRRERLAIESVGGLLGDMVGEPTT